ncbi:Copine-5 [Gracilariopsis chorda]|uniref:Copine-5 n=1 Tax=Gracilariopsis chorda TaxID=448386 RepID=A0A2V3IJ09_9FLOR|nr:Copine-5 [Gracilariopsis chorda]|eukprot:PXF42067.1 Copine-5 [Gracilariopsis chorda]
MHLPHLAQIELRFSANNLANKDLFSLSDPFLVCHTLRNGLPVDRIGRTETVRDDLNPLWATTISFTYDPLENASSALLIDIFDRDSPSDTALSKHDFLGRAVLRISRLLSAPNARLDIPLAPAKDILFPATTTISLVTDSNSEEERLARDSMLYVDTNPSPRQTNDLRRATTSSRASKNVTGTLSVFAEVLSPQQGNTFIFRVSSAMLRDASTLGRRVTQFYEVQRERIEGDRTSWSVVYRSKDGLTVNANNYVVFDEFAMAERQLHNMNPKRRLRIAFYKRHTRKQHELISYINTSMHDIMQSRFRLHDVAIPLEGRYGDEDALGNVLIRRIDKWEHPPIVPDVSDAASSSSSTDRTATVYVHLRADHFLHKRFVSSLNDSPRNVSRRLRQLPAFITMH